MSSVVNLDMQSPDHGIAILPDGEVAHVSREDGVWTAELPYLDLPWHRGGYSTARAALSAAAKQAGDSTRFAVRVHREY